MQDSTVLIYSAIAILISADIFIALNFFRQLYGYHRIVPAGRDESLYNVIYRMLPESKRSIYVLEKLLIAYSAIVLIGVFTYMLWDMVYQEPFFVVVVTIMAVLLLILSNRYFMYIHSLYLLGSIKERETVK